MIAGSNASEEAVAGRLAELGATVGLELQLDIAEVLAAAPADTLGGSVIPAAAADELIERHGLASRRELALLALPVAREMARPVISGFEVPAVGIEVGSGDLVLGANLEFAGTDLLTTVHAEGFVALRARRRRRALGVLAVTQARPCAHCRQTLVEAAAADDLRLIDLRGREVRLDQLYPEAFRPAALDAPGDDAAAVPWPSLAFVAPGDGGASPDLDADAAIALLAAGTRAHAPYSRAPSAVVLRLRDGRLLSAGCVESVAFNPTITATQAALVELAAARVDGAEIEAAWLGRAAGGPVDPEPGFRALIRSVAPHARPIVVDWRVG